MCSEEKDLKKLQLNQLENAIAVPIFDKQTGTPIAVVLGYNFNEENYLNNVDEQILMSLSNIFSACMFNMDNLQGQLINSDMLESAFSLSNEAILLINTSQAVTKLNKTAEILLNKLDQSCVGL
jgi:hypothetical protein